MNISTQLSARIKPKLGVFRTGMSLVKCSVVNVRFTHRALTLAIGIIVALIVAITLWMNQTYSLQVLKKSDVVSSETTRGLAKSALRMRIL